MTYEINKLAREIQDRLEAYNANIEWLAEDRKRKYGKPEEQTIIQPIVPTQAQSLELTPQQIKEQFTLRGEEFLNETITELGKLYPSQLYENQTQKLPSSPPPATHEEILRMVKKGDSIDGILLRFQGE